MAGAAASLDGLRAAPCDPLFLAVPTDGGRLRGLTSDVDWALAGPIHRLVKAGRMPTDAPLLWPASPRLPVGRLVLCRPGAFTARDLADVAAGFAHATPGICPEEFHLTEREVRDAFGGAVVIYEPLSDG